LAQLKGAGISEEVLAQRLQLIRQQVKLYSSNDHVRALQAGDVWAIVGWSPDLITLAERSNSVEVSVSAFSQLKGMHLRKQQGHTHIRTHTQERRTSTCYVHTLF